MRLSLGEQLLAWRLTRALSQPAAAEVLGVHVSSLNAVERGRRDRLPYATPMPNDLPATVERGDLLLVLARRRLKLGQVAMAERLGVAAYWLRCWESGKPGTEPPPAAVAAAVEALRAPHSPDHPAA